MRPMFLHGTVIVWIVIALGALLLGQDVAFWGALVISQVWGARAT